MRAEIADRMVETEVGHNRSYRLAWMQSSGRIPNYEASVLTQPIDVFLETGSILDVDGQHLERMAAVVVAIDASPG